MTIQVERVMHVEPPTAPPSHADKTNTQANPTSNDMTVTQPAVQATMPLQPPTGPRNKAPRNHHFVPRLQKGAKMAASASDTLFIGQ